MVGMDVDVDDFVQNATHAAEMNATIGKSAIFVFHFGKDDLSCM